MNSIASYRARAPYVTFLLALILGILPALMLPVSKGLYVCLWMVLVVLCCGFGAVFIRIIKYKKFKLFGIAGLNFLLIVAFWGWILTWKDHPLIDKLHFSHYKTASSIIGYLSDEPNGSGAAMRVEFKVTAVRDCKGNYREAHGQLLLHIRDEQLDTSLAYGDELLLAKKYQPIRPPYNPHEFHYARYMSYRNCWHRSYHEKGDYIKTGNRRGAIWVAAALSARKQMISKFGVYFTNAEALAMMSTLVLGYRASLDKELVQAFSATGTIHVLAVSGMHVAIVFAFLSFGLKWMGRNALLKFIRLIVLLCFVWFYTFITGFSASVLRAALMISFLMAGNNFSKDPNTVNNIAASAFLLLLFNPKYLTDVGFQLSYLAVIGIIWLTPIMMQSINLSNILFKKGLNYISLSCGAQLMTSPLVLYYFHSFPVYFLPANIFITLPASLMIYVGFFLLALPINPFSLWVASFLEEMIIIVNRGLLKIETWPFSTLKGIWLNPWESVFLYLLLLLGVLAFCYFQKRVFYTLLVALSVMGLWLNMRLWNRNTTQQLLVFHVSNHIAIALLDGSKPILYSDAASIEAPFLQYAVVPAISALSNMENISFIPAPAKLHYGDTQIRNKLLCFMGRELLIVDGDEEVILQDVSPEWVLIRNNPKIRSAGWMNLLKKRVLLLIDDSNSRYTIQELDDLAADLGLDVYHLNDNFAYVWDAKKQQ